MIYLDNSATTRPDEEVVSVVSEMLRENFANPGSLHFVGAEAYRNLGIARHQVAQLLGAPTESIIFTASGTQANNMAILGAVPPETVHKSPVRIVTTAAEHASVLQPVAYLERLGCEVVRVPLRPDGQLDPYQVINAVTPYTRLVSIMTVNNETGAIFPVAEITDAVHQKSPYTLVHTDFVQGFGKIPLHVSACRADIISVSGHKIHAPKGSGALYVRDLGRLSPILFGGSQEKRLNPGTENTPVWCGFGLAAQKCMSMMDINLRKVTALRDLLSALIADCSNIKINSPRDALPYVLNLSVIGQHTQEMVNRLSAEDIYISGGAACEKGAPSHVLLTMGVSDEAVRGALRISFCRENTEEEVRTLAEWLHRFSAEVL